jgi:hypothetical protein
VTEPNKFGHSFLDRKDIRLEWRIDPQQGKIDPQGPETLRIDPLASEWDFFEIQVQS